MLDMFSTGNTSLILLVILGAITVYYIVTDETSKIAQPKKKEEDPKPVDNGEVDSVEEVKNEVEQKPKNIERKQSTSNKDVNPNIMEQTDDYRPTHSAPLPKIKSVTTTTEYYIENENKNQSTTNNTPTEEPDEELNLSSFESDDIEVQCQWCDNIIKMKKGSTVVCPRCSGTVEG